MCIVAVADGTKSTGDMTSSNIRSKPSPLVFYLCSMFVPVCPRDFLVGLRRRGGRRRSTLTGSVAAAEADIQDDELIPPCRELCNRVKAGCDSVLARHGLVWPAELDCAVLPRHDTGICVSPDSMDNHISTDRSDKPLG